MAGPSTQPDRTLRFMPCRRLREFSTLPAHYPVRPPTTRARAHRPRSQNREFSTLPAHPPASPPTTPARAARHPNSKFEIFDPARAPQGTARLALAPEHAPSRLHPANFVPAPPPPKLAVRTGEPCRPAHAVAPGDRRVLAHPPAWPAGTRARARPANSWLHATILLLEHAPAAQSGRAIRGSPAW